DSDQRSLGFSRQGVEVAVGALADVANALMQIAENRFAMEFLPLLIEIDPVDMPALWNLALPQAAYEHVVLPGGNLVSSIEGQSGGRDGRYPEHYRWFHIVLIRLLSDARTQIKPAKTHDRPAIILARLEDIDFIAAVWAGLTFPDRSRIRLDSEAQHVAMSYRVNFGPIACASNERIIWRNGPIIAEPQHLPSEIVRILCAGRARRISDTDAHVNHSVLTEHDVRCITALNGRKNIARIMERASVPAPSRERNCPCVVAGRAI